MTKPKTRPTAKAIYENSYEGYEALEAEVLDHLAEVDAEVVREDNSFDYEYWGCRGYHKDVSYDVEIKSGADRFTITQTYKEPIDEDEMDVEGWDPISDPDDRSAIQPGAKLVDLTQVENADGAFTATFTFEVDVHIDDSKLAREYEESNVEYDDRDYADRDYDY